VGERSAVSAVKGRIEVSWGVGGRCGALGCWWVLWGCGVLVGTMGLWGAGGHFGALG